MGNTDRDKGVYDFSEIKCQHVYLNHRIDFQTARTRVKDHREAWSIAEDADGRVRRGLLPPPSTRPASFGADDATLQPDAYVKAVENCLARCVCEYWYIGGIAVLEWAWSCGHDV